MFSSYRSVSSAFKAAFAAEGYTGEARRRFVFVAISWRVAGEVRDRRPHGVAAANRLHPAARLRHRCYPVSGGTRGAPACLCPPAACARVAFFLSFAASPLRSTSPLPVRPSFDPYLYHPYFLVL